jgi:alkylation response protein AidB-like acyl-CoA dehydrogenase
LRSRPSRARVAWDRLANLGQKEFAMIESATDVRSSAASRQVAPTLKARAEGLLATVAEEAPRNEAAGRLAERTMTALRDSGLFDLLVPKSLGGLEAGIVEALEIFETVCEADGSTGWVLMACNLATGAAGAFLPQAGTDVVFGSRPVIIAGQGAPNGRAEIDGDGYRLSGKWSYGSGILHADYLHTGALVYKNGAVAGARTFIVPMSQVKLLGNWDVIGLRATGSVDYALENVFVPREFTHSPNTLAPLRGGSLYRLGIVGLSPLGHGAFAMGVGHRVLRELAASATTAAPPGPLKDSKSRESFHENYAIADGKMRAGRAFLYDVYRDAEQTLAAGNALSTRQFTLIRLALNNVTLAASEACAFAYQATGGVTLRNGVLQRCIRDMMAGAQHRIVSAFMRRECANELLGLADAKVWTSFGLVDPARAT